MSVPHQSSGSVTFVNEPVKKRTGDFNAANDE